MPGISTTGSTNIAVLDSKIIASLCDGNFYVDLSPSIYIGDIADGANNVLGANVEIVNPYGVIVKPYGTNYEISPALSGAMDAAISFPIPTQAGNYQYGTYTINVQLFDEGGASWIVTKTVKLCLPDKNNKTRNYGSLSAELKADCVGGKLFIIVDGVPTYNGYLMESQVLTGTLKYPTASGISPLAITTGNFSVVLFEGVYLLEGEICATYNYGDNVFVKVKYKIKKEKNVRCLIDRCCVLEALVELQARTETDCTAEEKERTASTILEALNLLTLVELAANCGEDPSSYVDDLEKLLGCKCTCNCAEGTPIIGVTPSSDVVIEGCNIETDVTGLTTTYTINNYAYVVSIAENGGALVISAATLDGCTKTQVITFNIATVYSQIKTLANQNDTEAAFWASVINKVLAGLNPSCLGITGTVWDNYTFAQKMNAVFTKMCDCCGCAATVTAGTIINDGADVTVTWTENASVGSVEIYLDGLLKATLLAGVLTYTFAGAADGDTHEYIIKARCTDGSYGNSIEDDFAYLGCPDIAPPTVSGTSFSDVDCPFDLTAIVTPPAAGLTTEYHNADNTLAASLVAEPTQVYTGSYYIYNRNDDGCYSLYRKVVVICETSATCTAPQNVEVIEFGGSSHLVRFQSAAYPPPADSYTVKRRLYSDPDVDGSYTTLGSPTWNSGMNRWVLDDTTALDNVSYFYKVQSNCGDSPATTPFGYDRYMYITCPSVTLTPGDTTVGYSFTGVGGDVDQYKVEIWNASLTTLIHTDTHLPAFPTPITGTFEYLDQGTEYKVRVIVYGYGSKNCPFQSVTTNAAP